jgi:adenine deaminase
MTEILLSGGALIDGSGAVPRPASVLVSGDRIVAVGADADAAGAAGGATVIDVSGLTVMPGLIDAHVHVTLGEPASNAGINLALVVDDAPHKLCEEGLVSRGKGLALLRADRTVKPVLGELPNHRLHPDP